MDKSLVTDTLNNILEFELGGVVRYTHYSLMIFGINRIPLVEWFRNQAEESLRHAYLAGEHITGLGIIPSLNISNAMEAPKKSIEQILHEALLHEKRQVDHYKILLGVVENKDLALEEYAREMIAAEESQARELEKMLRTSGPIDLKKSEETPLAS